MKRSIFCAKCGLINCVCKIQTVHAKDCKFRVSMQCPIGIACEHGYDVCPICDACTCGVGEGNPYSRTNYAEGAQPR